MLLYSPTLVSTLPVTVCEGEGTFSKLTIISSLLRTTMKQNRLNAHAVIAIEDDIARKMSSKTIIDKFSC